MPNTKEEVEAFKASLNSPVINSGNRLQDNSTPKVDYMKGSGNDPTADYSDLLGKYDDDGKLNDENMKKISDEFNSRVSDDDFNNRDDIEEMIKRHTDNPNSLPFVPNIVEPSNPSNSQLSPNEQGNAEYEKERNTPRVLNPSDEPSMKEMKPIENYDFHKEKLPNDLTEEEKYKTGSNRFNNLQKLVNYG